VAVFGTASDVGKSVVAAALCRILSDRGHDVAPFKAQNMSNNSGVTPEGLEMGRAQIVQAEAARIPPHVDMNPILLKPAGEKGSQVVLGGRALGERSASAVYREKDKLFSEVKDAFDRLRRRFETIVIEGAGSCAEMNLAENDIVNFQMAEAAEAPAVLVADIDRGGVFAQIVGTLECLPPARRDRIAGFIVNRFRGDIDLFKDGVRWIEKKTGRPVFGVVPFFSNIAIHAEDAVVLETAESRLFDPIARPTVAVIRLPHISNFTDFDPLKGRDAFDLVFLERPRPLSALRALIIPGSKNTRGDLQWLKHTGWEKEIRKYVQEGGKVTGICGGYQIMGTAVHDPEGLEGAPGLTPGLSLLPVETVLAAPKTTTVTRFIWGNDPGVGYEIHMGRTTASGGRPLLSVEERNGNPCREVDGCLSEDGRFMGTYLHGLFDEPKMLRRWLAAAGIKEARSSELSGLAARDREYDKLAAHFARHLDLHSMFACLKLPPKPGSW
jgi:adenosylcobyric acid synthase